MIENSKSLEMELLKFLTERERKIYTEINEGKRFVDIYRGVGVSYARARQIYEKAKETIDYFKYVIESKKVTIRELREKGFIPENRTIENRRLVYAYISSKQ